jgi:hypothetical protein
MPAIRHLVVKTRRKTPTRCFVIGQKCTKTDRLLFLMHLETHEKGLPCVLILSFTALAAVAVPPPHHFCDRRSTNCEDRIGTGPPRARTENMYVVSVQTSPSLSDHSSCSHRCPHYFLSPGCFPSRVTSLMRNISERTRPF